MLKKKLTSNYPSSTKSVQCTPFLTLSDPNFALIECGNKILAISGSCGPHNDLKSSTALSYLTSNIKQGPLVM